MPADSMRGQRLAVTGTVVTLLAAAAAAWAAARTGSFAAAAAAAHLLVGAVVWLAGALHTRRLAAADLARRERERLLALVAEGRRALFDAGAHAAEQDSAARRFERVAFLAFALAVGALELTSAVWLLRSYPVEQLRGDLGLGLGALLAGTAFVLLVLGRYALAVGAAPNASAARAGGRRAASGALVAFLAGLALAVQEPERGGSLLGLAAWGLTRLDLVGYALAGLAAALGLEAGLLLLLELYRPRRTQEAARPPYDSRLLGLLSAPGDVARSIARAVDYQFGFSLSQTWLYRFLERWILPLGAFAALVFWALSALVAVGPHEQALVRRLGVTRPELLGPGLHLELPWPLASVERLPTGRVHEVVTGGHLAGEHDLEVREPSLLWTADGHADELGEDEDPLVLIARESTGPSAGTPVNLLSASATVHYSIADPRAFRREVQDPAALLEVLAERELCSLLRGEDLDALLRERGAHAARLREALRARAAAFGVRVESASLTDLHPPVEVGEAFEAITVAQERREAERLTAEVEAIRTVERARAEAARIVADARARAAARVALARVDAARFAGLRALDRAAPGVFRTSRLLEGLVRGAAGSRLVVLGRTDGVQTDLDLQEKVSVEEIGLGLEPAPTLCPTCDAPLEPSWTRCPRCGKELEDR